MHLLGGGVWRQIKRPLLAAGDQSRTGTKGEGAH